MDRNILHMPKLLSDIAEGLKPLDSKTSRTPLSCIEVTFHVGGRKRYSFGLPQALDVLAEDLYWDERGNWAEATHATVRTI